MIIYMENLNFKWLKLYWRKLVITLLTIFIVATISYTVYNYVTPVKKSKLSTKSQNTKKDICSEKHKDSSNNNTIVESSESSEKHIKKDLEKDTSINFKNENNKSSLNSQDMSKNSTDKKTIQYKVQSGDTLFSICRKYMPYKDTNEAITTLKELNKMESISVLKTGQMLNIPTYNSPEAKNPNITDNINTLTYTAKPGDTLFSIAKNYMTWCNPKNAVMEIIKLNNLKEANFIKAGQKIIIPCNTQKSAN